MRRPLLYGAFISILLAGCGGGGGGSAPSSQPPTQTQANVQQVPVQRSLANQSLQTQYATQQSFTFGSSTGTLSSVRRAIDASARRVTSAWRAGTAVRAQGTIRRASVTYGPCTNNTETATVAVSTTEEQLYERTFYDSACTQLYQDMFLDVVATSSTAGTITGTDTEYSVSGAFLDYVTLTMNMSGIGTSAPQFSLQATSAANSTAQPTVQFGVACGLGSSSSLACGFGGVDTVQALSQDEGVTLNLAASATTSTTSVTVPVSGNAAAYTGATGALKLTPGTFPAWTISGGTLSDSATLNGQFSYSTAGVIAGASLTLTDSADDGTVTLTAGGTPETIAGTIKQTDTGKQVATFSVDASGNGTITYSNGTTGTIQNWVVTG